MRLFKSVETLQSYVRIRSPVHEAVNKIRYLYCDGFRASRTGRRFLANDGQDSN